MVGSRDRIGGQNRGAWNWYPVDALAVRFQGRGVRLKGQDVIIAIAMATLSGPIMDQHHEFIPV
jgi:hypothetical protein